ncbi:Glucosyl-3-phosphoglycerate phosphatase [Corynebacterium capitovis DSM 44611]|uniref:histidine phosphatase family protein n=1 Tax=Corynebacterium capitovis TaxID=131081 RepID=UPI000590DF2B|nr:histidine phosphatase family protein [Corynebacterium capitovis]WKD57199.1 Glucosyl-3-phosphoglycerate phosphatase [Corynebacterium capitovis DSM 44611]
MSRRLILLRHGQTGYNSVRRMQGQLDTELNALGEDQARAAARALVGARVTKIVSSDLMRARRTAEIVASELGLEISLDPRLRETHLGQWQGRTHEEVDSLHQGIRAHWRNNAAWAPPAGESRLDVARRARPVVDELVESYERWEGNTVLIVAHGGTISALTSNLLGLEERQYPLLKGLKNSNTSQLTALPRYGSDRSDPTDVQWYLDAWNQGAGQ